MKHEDAEQMIQDCMVRIKKMSEWECDFIQNVDEYLTDHGTISNKQYEQLTKIWERVT